MPWTLNLHRQWKQEPECHSYHEGQGSRDDEYPGQQLETEPSRPPRDTGRKNHTQSV